MATAPTILGTPSPYPQGPGPHREGGAFCAGAYLPSYFLSQHPPLPACLTSEMSALALETLPGPPRILEPQHSPSEPCSLYILPRSQTPPAGGFLTAPPGTPELAVWGRDRPGPWALKLVTTQQPRHRALGAQGCPYSACAAEPSRAEAGFLAQGTWQMSERPAGLRVEMCLFLPIMPWAN